MILINSKKNILGYIPQQGYDMNQIMTGKQACAKTIGGWEIGSCALIQKESYKTILLDGHDEMNMDEVDFRRLLLMAKTVSFCDAVYYYRQYGSSITKKISIKLFDRMYTSYELMNIIFDSFSKEEAVYYLAVSEFWGNVSNGLLSLLRHYFSFSEIERTHIKKTIRIYYRKSQDLKSHMKMNRLKKALMLNGYPLFFYKICRLDRTNDKELHNWIGENRKRLPFLKLYKR